MDPAPDVLDAFATLGVDPATADTATVRSAYLAAVRATHPDLHDRAGATAATALLTTAYRVAVEAIASAPAAPAIPSAPSGPAGRAPSVLRVVADDTIEVDAPLDLTFGWLLHAGHDMGDITFLDRSGALLQVLVEFVDEPVCQLIFDLQGRAARGTTEVFCTIESIDDRPPPEIASVTAFVAGHLATAAAAG